MTPQDPVVIVSGLAGGEMANVLVGAGLKSTVFGICGGKK